MPKPLYKHTLVIWARDDLLDSDIELVDLAREAIDGSAYCSMATSELIQSPQDDPAWDGTEFFDDEADE